MKTRTRILCIILAIATALCLVSCGKSAQRPDADTPIPSGQVQPSPSEAPAAPQTPDDDAKTNEDAQEPAAPQEQSNIPEQDEPQPPAIDEDGEYDSKDDVALYIYTYGHLPSNYITKKQAQALGWEGGSLEPYAPGKSICGSRFGNYEGLLPEKEGRSYTECDIDTKGKKSRGAKRIVFSNDGLIFYTEDHYESFELLYGEY